MPPVNNASLQAMFVTFKGQGDVLTLHTADPGTTKATARVAGNTDLPWHLVIIDDASPDPRMSAMARTMCDRSAVTTAAGGSAPLLATVCAEPFKTAARTA